MTQGMTIAKTNLSGIKTPSVHAGPSSVMRISDTVLLLLRIGIGVVFLYSSVPKILQPYDFLTAIYMYELGGLKLGLIAAVVIPALELLIGICLITGVMIEGALLSSVFLFCMFVVVQSSALWRGLQISCGCFKSSADHSVSYMTLIRVLLLLAASSAISSRITTARNKPTTLYKGL